MHAQPPYGRALGLLEIRSIARGIVVCDALVKRARVRLPPTDTIPPGNSLTLFDGDEASPDEAFGAGIDAAKASLLDNLSPAPPDPEVWTAPDGKLPPPPL